MVTRGLWKSVFGHLSIYYGLASSEVLYVLDFFKQLGREADNFDWWTALFHISLRVQVDSTRLQAVFCSSAQFMAFSISTRLL